MRKCDFNKVASQLKVGRSPVNLLHIFRTPFFRNTSGWLLLPVLVFEKKADQEILFTKFLIVHGYDDTNYQTLHKLSQFACICLAS